MKTKPMRRFGRNRLLMEFFCVRISAKIQEAEKWILYGEWIFHPILR